MRRCLLAAILTVFDADIQSVISARPEAASLSVSSVLTVKPPACIANEPVTYILCQGEAQSTCCFTGLAVLHHELCQMYLSQPCAFPVADVLTPACLFLAGPKGNVNLAGASHLSAFLSFVDPAYLSAPCFCLSVCLLHCLRKSVQACMLLSLFCTDLGRDTQQVALDSATRRKISNYFKTGWMLWCRCA